MSDSEETSSFSNDEPVTNDDRDNKHNSGSISTTKKNSLKESKDSKKAGKNIGQPNSDSQKKNLQNNRDDDQKEQKIKYGKVIKKLMELGVRPTEEQQNYLRTYKEQNNA